MGAVNWATWGYTGLGVALGALLMLIILPVLLHKHRYVPVQSQVRPASLFNGASITTAVLWRCRTRRCHMIATSVLDGRWVMDDLHGTGIATSPDGFAVTSNVCEPR
jgi:hypothetical protein